MAEAQRPAKDCSDLSLTPEDENEFAALEMFAVARSAKAAAEKTRSKDERRARRAAAG